MTIEVNTTIVPVGDGDGGDGGGIVADDEVEVVLLAGG